MVVKNGGAKIKIHLKRLKADYELRYSGHDFLFTPLSAIVCAFVWRNTHRKHYYIIIYIYRYFAKFILLMARGVARGMPCVAVLSFFSSFILFLFKRIYNFTSPHICESDFKITKCCELAWSKPKQVIFGFGAETTTLAYTAYSHVISILIVI